ncbi:TetR/AcrR family transcriptional regulator [Streptomyces sp. NPDC048639]|uniref:TetR/AcrR family transcriptional regulator n=1 Tax=Streptomyces sp. NPDC048639 TaxID=3365581 RepID=UPI00371C7A2C
MQTEPRPQARRTRLTPERESELYEAVLALLREVGYDALTMDAIAARTRSSKATLYRQWNSKPELVARALGHIQPVSPAEVDTGSLRGDMQELLDSSDDDRMEMDTALLRGLAHAVYQNEDLHAALRRFKIQPEIDSINVMLQRAVARGEVPADLPALEWVPQLLIGAFLTRQLIEDLPADRDHLARFVHAVIFPVLGV